MAIRHKLELAIAYIELKPLSQISENQSKSVTTQVVAEVGKRMRNHLRDEEIVARIDTSKFALLLPLTSCSNSMTAIKRVKTMVRSMKFAINKNKLRFDIAVGISSLDKDDTKPSFNDLCMKADTALQKSIDSSDRAIVSHCTDGKGNAEPGVKVQYDYFLNKSLPYIIDGNFKKIPDDHLKHIMGILKPFIRYASLKDSSNQ